MANAFTMWNKDQDTAIIQWDHKPSDWPLDPLNHLLMMFYNQEPSTYPYIYAVYDGLVQIGLLVSGSMEIPNGSEGDLIFAAMFNDIVESERIAPSHNDYRMQEWNV